MKLCKQEVNVRQNKLLSSLWKYRKFFFQFVLFLM